MQLHYDPPSGPFPVSVRDGEVLDTAYPALRPEDSAGRRLMVRVWYPAINDRGPRRSYLADGDLATVRGFVDAFGVLPEQWFDQLGELETHSTSGAGPAAGPFPTLVFSHGAGGYVTQNTALMEHLASHGYIVWGIAHVGEAGAVTYSTGEVVPLDATFKAALMGLADDAATMPRMTGDIGTRYAAVQEQVDDRALGPWQRRWVDDQRAVIDALEAGTVTGSAADLVGHCDLARIGLFGMSFGAAAAVSTAQQDSRVSAVVNLDGGQYRSDVLDADVRLPMLHLGSDFPASYAAMGITPSCLDFNEFFFEPLCSMGRRDDVQRLRIEGTTHIELMDLVLIPAEARRSVLPGGGQIDGRRAIDIMNAFISGYFDHVLLGKDNGYPGAQRRQYSEVIQIDLTDIRTWAQHGG